MKPAAAGVAITIDSANKVKNEGEVAFDDKSASTAVLFTGGGPASFENLGTLRLAEDFTGKDDDSDGDLDGVFATGSGRHGVRLAAGTTLAGSITNGATGVITIEGNDSSGIRLDGRLRGNLVNAGSISIIGDRSVGVLATAVEGDVAITGSVVAVGEGSSAVTLGDVTGAVRLQNAITATGYRTTDRLAEAARAKLDADDLKQGGAAVRISGNVGGGILLDRPPVDASADDKDEDKDGTPDADERTASLTSFGAAPALDLGGAGATVIGRVGTGDNGYGLVIKGQVRGLGINDGVAATAIRIGQPGGGTTTIDGGINNVGGTITATAFGAGATGLLLNSGARADMLRNSGEITHQFLVIRSDLPTAELPRKPGNMGVDETQLDVVGRIAAIPAGDAAEVSVPVETGKYVLICNLFAGGTSHYLSGMYNAFEVTQAAPDPLATTAATATPSPTP